MISYDDVYIEPRHSDIETRDNVNLSTQFTRNRVIGCPVVASPMDTVVCGEMIEALDEEGATGIMHRFGGHQYGKVNQIDELKNVSVEGPLSVSVGAKGDVERIATSIINHTGADVVLVDVAHGDHKYVKSAISKLREDAPKVDIIAGNVATAEGALRLADWGADAIRVGIGNGSVCSTRIKTGVGVPQVTAIREISEALDRWDNGYSDVPVIADGGIRTPGDAAKALAAGADTVMVGSILAGTDETPGELKARETDWPDRELYKEYRGSASQGVKGSDDYVEGVTRTVPYRGSVKRIIGDMKDGLRSSFSYVGARTVGEFQAKANLIEVSGSAAQMGQPHHGS